MIPNSKILIATLAMVTILLSPVAAQKKTIARLSKLTNAKLELLRDGSQYSLKFESKRTGLVHNYVLTPATGRELNQTFQRVVRISKSLSEGQEHREFVQLQDGRIYFSAAKLKGHADIAVVAAKPGVPPDKAPTFFVSFDEAGAADASGRRAKEVKSFFSRIGLIR